MPKITNSEAFLCYYFLMENKFLTPKECAALLSKLENKKISRRHVYYLIEMYNLVGVRIGGQYRITAGEVKRYHEQKCRFLHGKLKRNDCQTFCDFKRGGYC